MAIGWFYLPSYLHICVSHAKIEIIHNQFVATRALSASLNTLQ